MNNVKALIMFLTLAIATQGCDKDAPISSETIRTTIQSDTIPINQLPSQFDSLTFYVNNEVGWGFQLNPYRADSLANWFAQGSIQIMDMWFPVTNSICGQTVITYNEVYVRLNSPDSTLITLGFAHTDRLDFCFRAWKHYTFTRTSDGG